MLHDLNPSLESEPFQPWSSRSLFVLGNVHDQFSTLVILLIESLGCLLSIAWRAHLNESSSLRVALVVVEKSCSDRVEVLRLEEVHQILLVHLESKVGNIHHGARASALLDHWGTATWWASSLWSEATTTFLVASTLTAVAASTSVASSGTSAPG